MASNNSVSAIAVLDLARELRLLNILNSESLLSIEASFANCLEQGSNNNSVNQPTRANMVIALERRIPESVLVDLWGLAAESSVCPEVGVLIGSKVNHDAKGVLANWISQCQTLEEAFKTFHDNIILLNAAENWTVEYRAEDIKLSFKFSSQYDYPVAAIERSMSALIAWSSDLCGAHITVESASFRHAIPKYKNLYTAIFGSNISFSANENSLIFKPSILTWPIKNANSYLQEVVEQRAQKVLVSTLAENVSGFTSEKVRALLLTNLARFNSVESVCQEIHLSRTGLYRKLKAENNSFRGILEEVQLEKYQQGIEKGMAVGELCDLLGFSDPSTFYKARKRWARI